MSKRFTYATTLTWGGDTPTAEIDVEVSFTVAWGSPANPCLFDPGSGDAVEDIRLEKVEGKPRPWAMGYGYITDDDFAEDCIEKIEGSDRELEAMLIEAVEEAAADHWDAIERRAEERAEFAWTGGRA